MRNLKNNFKKYNILINQPQSNIPGGCYTKFEYWALALQALFAIFLKNIYQLFTKIFFIFKYTNKNLYK